MRRLSKSKLATALSVLLTLAQAAPADDVAQIFFIRQDVARQTSINDSVAVWFEYKYANGIDLPDNAIEGRCLSDKVGLPDSIEGVNRVVGSCTDGVMMWVFRPIAVGYATIFPRCVVTGFRNLTTNIAFPVRVFSCMLQAKFSDSGQESLRFLTNTTLGVAGFFEVAEPWFGLHPHDEDFGQAFASWGIGTGCYLFAPAHGPTDIRDGCGSIFDYAFDPKTYIYGGQWFTKINNGTDDFEAYRKLRDGNKDPYKTMQDVWFIVRKVKIQN